MRRNKSIVNKIVMGLMAFSLVVQLFNVGVTFAVEKSERYSDLIYDDFSCYTNAYNLFSKFIEDSILCKKIGNR